MGASPCCMKRKPIKKQESVTKFIRRNQSSISNMRTIRERHENTKEKLNQLITNSQNSLPQKSQAKDVDNTEVSRSIVAKSNEMQTQINQSNANRSPNLLPIHLLNKNNESGKIRGSFSYSNTFEEKSKLNLPKVESENPLSIKRRSQTYHSFFKSPDKMNSAQKSKKSRKSRRSHRMSNPFIPPSSKLISSSSSEKMSTFDYHIVAHLSDNKICSTEKAVNLKTGNPLIIKIFKYEEEKKQKLELFNRMLGLLNTADKKCSTLIKYHKFKLDEDTGKIILIEEHSKCINVEYYIKNYGYYDESKIKIVVFQIIKAIQFLSSIGFSHGKLCLMNIFISSKFKVKVSDYALYSINSDLTLEDQVRIDLFDLGICILKMLGILLPNDEYNFYDCDKRNLK